MKIKCQKCVYKEIYKIMYQNDIFNMSIKLAKRNREWAEVVCQCNEINRYVRHNYMRKEHNSATTLFYIISWIVFVNCSRVPFCIAAAEVMTIFRIEAPWKSNHQTTKYYQLKYRNLLKWASCGKFICCLRHQEALTFKIDRHSSLLYISENIFLFKI